MDIIKPRRVLAIRKGYEEAGVIAELVSLLETVTEDGMITDSEVEALQTWLQDNSEVKSPAIEFLLATVSEILQDGRVTEKERKILQLAVERVLPVESRRTAKAKRLA